ncbi:hypothetical protein EV673_1725 [Limnobacter thiooxidans]|uniref:Uncharacterized protein n=1 Tax=Limnobacter thiooxidans TaxID=131080 RepID=A0AA86J207_9BURK|nr:hypothetical protein EV673_1725 [Limnobacter thiooxidans]BET27603.1 hypothetical protein RGQ30_31040 [Limnobacter thiooxidans]
MNFSIKALAISTLVSMSFSSHAGEFSCSLYGNVDCAEHIKKLVTDKFTSKFPSTKFEIVAVSEFQVYSDGGGVGYAVVGVVPKVSESDKYGNLSLFPIRRFSATRRITGQDISPYQKTQNEIEVLQSAVEGMMEACHRDKACNVMTMR